MSTTVGVELDYYGSPQPHPKQLSVELILEIIAVVASPLVAPDRDTTVHSDPEELVRFESSTEYRAFRTLTAASLVSRTWNDLCRPHIFRTLFISTKNPIARLTFLHFSAPHLAEHIRVLRLWWNHNHPDLRALHTLNMGWFPSCFTRLTNLQELYLGQWFGRRVVPPAPLTVGMSSIFSAPLRKLVLRGWGFSGKSYLPAFSMLAHTLEDLRLDKIVTDEIELPTPPDHIRLEALRNLELRDIDHPVLRCPNFIECPNLRRFTARWTCFEPWCVPTWVPANLPELVLEGTSLTC